MSKASIFSPSNEPIFDGQVVRNPTRVQQQGGGGDGEFPFQWSWPGLINYTAGSPGIPSISGHSITSAYYTVVSAGGPIQVGVYVNGILQDSVSFSTSGSVAMPITIAAGSIVGVALLNVGFANAQGLWFGLTTIS